MTEEQTIDKNTWSTPEPEYQGFRKIVDFQIDAAASAENTKCERWFGFDNGFDALKVDWLYMADYWKVDPIFFCNPPYQTELIKQFMATVYKESARGATVGSLILPSTCSQWWHDYVLPVITPKDKPIPTIKNLLLPEPVMGEGRGGIIYPEKRIQFVPPKGYETPIDKKTGKPRKDSNNRDSVFVVFYPPEE